MVTFVKNTMWTSKDLQHKIFSLSGVEGSITSPDFQKKYSA